MQAVSKVCVQLEALFEDSQLVQHSHLQIALVTVTAEFAAGQASATFDTLLHNGWCLSIDYSGETRCTIIHCIP